jgi:hypothetical protein
MSTTEGLRLADELVLPLEAVTETFAILAKRGKGKTSTAVVMAEELIAQGMPVVVLDPVGVWWGLRSSADGKDAGLPVVIFGGDHADVPLEETAGQVIADVIVEQRFPAVIDLSSLSKSAARRFMAPFLERLYHRNRDALHVIVDEADAFAPQRTQADGARLLGAMEDLVRRGRARGIGVTLITQRPAVLHKDVLTQAEVLIALGMTGPRDVAAIDEWVRLHADEDQAREVKASLPSLPVGTAWVWSPGWLDILQRVQIRRRTTFDSSATPKPGQQRATPKRMADIDLAALGDQITSTVEKAKADDPRQLRARIRDLEQQLAAAQAARPDTVVERVEVPVITAEDLATFRDVEINFTGEVHSVLQQLERVQAAVSDLDARLAEYPPTDSHKEMAGSPAPRRSAPGDRITSSSTRGARDAGDREVHPPAARETRPVAAGGLPKAQRAILTVLAQHGARTKRQVGLLSGYSSKGGGFNNALSALSTAGHIVRGELLEITDSGLEALGPVDPLPTGRELVEHHARGLTKAAREILDVLIEHYPGELTKDEIAGATPSQYAPTGGGFNNALSRLRSLELITTTGGLSRVADELVEDQ